MEGRKGASRRTRRSSRGRHTRSRAVLTGVLVTFLVLFVGAVVVAAVGASNYYDGLTHLDELQQVPQGQNSAIYARDGSRLTVIASDKNRRYVSLDRISKWLPEATIAIEDRRFYEHHGVDWKAVGRAAVKNLEAGRVAEGGSTLTQQLVRNIYPQITNEVTLKRKLNEALVARELEEQHPKQWILEQYLNTVPYGHSAYGAEAAAQIYFSKSAKDLTMAQAALLAGLPQGPSRYDPFVHARAAKDRRAEVLQAMLDQGVITQDEFAQASASKLGLKRGDLFGRTTEPYVEQYVRSQLESDTEFGASAVLGGGLKVTTTIDPQMQKLAYNAMRNVLKLPPCAGAPKASCDPAAALVSIRPSTGEIVAMTSTSKFKNTQFNFAQGQRQPGSTFKPFTLAAAIEAGINPATTYYQSAPFTIDKTDQWGQIYGPWKVHTADSGYKGRISLENATLASDNTVYAQLILDVGPEEVKDVAAADGHQPVDADGRAVADARIELGDAARDGLRLRVVRRAGRVPQAADHLEDHVRRLGPGREGEVEGQARDGRRRRRRGDADPGREHARRHRYARADDRRPARRPARPARPTTSATPGSAATRPISRRASGSAIRCPRSTRCTASRASARCTAARCRPRSGTASWTPRWRTRRRTSFPSRRTRPPSSRTSGPSSPPAPS